MKAAVSVAGRFHGFNLAAELHRRSGLAALLTSYPKFVAERFGVPRERVKSLPPKEILERLHRRLPPAWQRPGVEPALREWFDRWAARVLPDCDICTAWSGSGLHTLRTARRRGALTVVERGSAHIEYQRDILREEYQSWGGIPALPHPRTIDKELQEYEEADVIAVPSHFVKQTFLAKGFAEDRILHVPYGVDLSQFQPLPDHAAGPRPFRVIHCGALSLRKGAHYLLRAFAELALPRAELWCVGAVPTEIKTHLDRYGGRGIRLFGTRAQSLLAQYYGQCDLFCLMSIEEGLAMVIPQAMACGLPVVCTENTGGADLVRHGREGFVLPIRDVEPLKQTLLWCYENREACREMGRAARQRVQSGFSWGDYGDRTVSGYRAALDRHHARVA
jgi:glycosyltransferase involved in cell wall biosynthesis